MANSHGTINQRTYTVTWFLLLAVTLIMLATEAVMSGLAERLGQDTESWAMAGLMHDLDYDETADQPERHGLVSAERTEHEGF